MDIQNIISYWRLYLKKIGVNFVRFILDKNNILNGIYYCLEGSFYTINNLIKGSINAREFYYNSVERISIYTLGNKLIITSKFGDNGMFVFLGTKTLFNKIKDQYKIKGKPESTRITYTENLDSVFIEMAMKEYNITRMQAGELLYSNKLSDKDRKRRANIISKVQSRFGRW